MLFYVMSPSLSDFDQKPNVKSMAEYCMGQHTHGIDMVEGEEWLRSHGGDRAEARTSGARIQHHLEAAVKQAG